MSYNKVKSHKKPGLCHISRKHSFRKNTGCLPVVLGLQKSKEHHEESDRIKNTFVLYKQKQLLRFID